MKYFFYLFKYEVQKLFLSASTYIVAILFLILMGVIYLYVLQGMVASPQETVLSAQFFQSFWLSLFFLIPLLTMKSVAGERKQGTFETLKAAPIRPFTIVLSKFFSLYFFYLILWMTTLFFPIIVKTIIRSEALEGNLFSQASLLGGYSYIAINGMFYIAIGLFFSSLTRSQLIAGILTFACLFLLIVGSKVLRNASFFNDIKGMGLFESCLEYLNGVKSLEDFSAGVIDTRPFVFYLSLALAILGISTVVVQVKAN